MRQLSCLFCIIILSGTSSCVLALDDDSNPELGMEELAVCTLPDPALLGCSATATTLITAPIRETGNTEILGIVELRKSTAPLGTACHGSRWSRVSSKKGPVGMTARLKYSKTSVVPCTVDSYEG